MAGIIPPNPNAETVSTTVLLNAVFDYIIAQGAGATEAGCRTSVTTSTGESVASYNWRMGLCLQEMYETGTITAETFDASKTWVLEPMRTAAQRASQIEMVVSSITHLEALVAEKAQLQNVIAEMDAIIALTPDTDEQLRTDWEAYLVADMDPEEFIQLAANELGIRDDIVLQQVVAPQRKAIAEARIVVIDAELGI